LKLRKNVMGVRGVSGYQANQNLGAGGLGNAAFRYLSDGKGFRGNACWQIGQDDGTVTTRVDSEDAGA
jgi:hypothetical protein